MIVTYAHYTPARLLGVSLHPKPGTPVKAYYSIVYSDQGHQALLALTDLLLNQINPSCSGLMAGGCVLHAACSYMNFKTYIQTPDSTKS